MQSICVFCGSHRGNRLSYQAAAIQLGTRLAEQGTTLVYGGGNVGLMGEVANAALKAGGKVIGVVPEGLATKEIAHHALTELHIVKTMHQRKALMVADGTLAEQLYWGNVVKARELLQEIGFNQASAPLLLQAAYLELTLGAPERAEELLRSTAGLQHQRDPRFQSGWHELEARVLLERRDLLGAQRALLEAIEAPYALDEGPTNREPLLVLRAETLLALDQAAEARTLLDSLLADGSWSVRAALDRVELDLTKQNEVDLQADLELLVGRAPMLRRVMNVVLWYHSVARTEPRDESTLLQ